MFYAYLMNALIIHYNLMRIEPLYLEQIIFYWKKVSYFGLLCINIIYVLYIVKRANQNLIWIINLYVNACISITLKTIILMRPTFSQTTEVGIKFFWGSTSAEHASSFFNLVIAIFPWNNFLYRFSLLWSVFCLFRYFVVHFTVITVSLILNANHEEFGTHFCYFTIGKLLSVIAFCLLLKECEYMVMKETGIFRNCNLCLTLHQQAQPNQHAYLELCWLLSLLKNLPTIISI